MERVWGPRARTLRLSTSATSSQWPDKSMSRMVLRLNERHCNPPAKNRLVFVSGLMAHVGKCNATGASAPCLPVHLRGAGKVAEIRGHQHHAVFHGTP